jgi:hypothetical protein
LHVKKTIPSRICTCGDFLGGPVLGNFSPEVFCLVLKKA